MYATLGTRGTTATSPPGLIGTLPEEDETAEEHAAAAAPVPPMFADPPRKNNMTGKVRHSIFVNFGGKVACNEPFVCLKTYIRSYIKVQFLSAGASINIL